MKRWIVAVAFAVAGAACAAPGADPPWCAEDAAEVSTISVLQVQAVPTADWGPCLHELRVGWEYGGDDIESGRARFWLDSDRVGDGFLEVTLTPSCDVGSARGLRPPQVGVQRYSAVTAQPAAHPVAVVPAAQRHRAHAQLVTADIAAVAEDRSLDPYLAVGEDPTPDRVGRALAAGHSVVIIDDREAADDTVELRLPGHQPRTGLTLEHALEEIGEETPESHYAAVWYDVFGGGCISYEFDAQGPGAATIAVEVDESLGLFSFEDLRRLAPGSGS